MNTRRRWIARMLVLGVGGLLAGCTSTPSRSPLEPGPLLLISLDGFRWDYLDRYAEDAPVLRRLRAEGVSSEGLIPVFPSNTFPNHYSIVTGLYPAQHGMINNEFFDPDRGEFFRYTRPAANADARWWGGEPVWVTAEKQGRRTAVSFWVGSEAEIKGVRPTFWRAFDARRTFAERRDEVAGWLRLPAAERPKFIAFYFEDTNGAGHRHGPDSPAVAAAVRRLDQQVGELLAAHAAAGLAPNVVIVSDHGMLPVDPRRVAILDDHLDRRRVQIEIEGSVVALRPLDGDVAGLLAAARTVPHARAYLREDLPPHLRVDDQARFAPVWILPESGAHAVSRAVFASLQQRYPETGYLPGDHGYDPAVREMHGLLLAHGPAFRRGVTLPRVENVHVYRLLCAVLGVTPAPHAGDERLVRGAMAVR